MASAGCSISEPPEFRLNLEGRDPSQVSLDQVEVLTDTLADLFGTPDEPLLPRRLRETVVDLQMELLQMAAGPIGSDAAGNQWGLYRQHCVACHGISGDGAGPTAAMLDPYPRDFRNGVYKYTSTRGGAKPAWEDLERIVRLGMPGTSMPSFATLGDLETAALVEYVMYLSLRGETELFLRQMVVVEDRYPLDSDDVEELLEDYLEPTVQMWAGAPRAVVVPPPRPPADTHRQRIASIAAGRELFVGKNARCTECHGPEGDGRDEQGNRIELHDDWNKVKKGATPEQTRKLARLFQLPIQPLRPRDFTAGTFRGGSRPIDQYWRIHVGIKGTPMPAGGPAGGSTGVLTEEEIWHVVDYVRSLGE